MDIAIIGDSIYDLQLQASNKKLEILNKEKELRESKLYKELESIKQEEIAIDAMIASKKMQILQKMQEMKIKSMDFEHQKVTIKKNHGALTIEDESVIPELYKKEKVTVSIDKKKLKEDITLGSVVLPGVDIKSTYSLLITPKS